METKANYVIVGIFTILAILVAFGFVYWTARVGERGETAPLNFRIAGSAAGLGRGSAVLFNGVRVGEVDAVHLDYSNPRVALVEARVDRRIPVTQSTRADVGLAGLTGQANIELRGGNPAEPNLLDLAEEQGTVAEMTANPSAVADLLASAQSLMARADSVIGELDAFVREARGPLSQTIRNVETFSDAMRRNADGIDSFLASVTELSGTISDVSGRLESTLRATESLITAVDRQKVAKIVENVDAFTQRLSAASDDLETIMADVDRTVKSVSRFSEQANATLGKVDALVDQVKPDEVASAVRNFGEASRSINRASEDIARVSRTVGAHEEDIDQFIADAKQVASRLNSASVRVDGVLAKLDNLLGSGQTEDVFAQVSETLEAYRRVADTLNARIGTITDNLSRFSGKGLNNIEAMVSEARRSIARIEAAVSDFEQNPQRIITGGEGDIRRYDGRARR